MDRSRDTPTPGAPRRNTRPRDELGRPLPYGSTGVPRAPEGVRRTAAQTVTEAAQLLAAGRPFHAHEVFEDAWKAAVDGTERALWRGMAQLAVGLTHAARGNPAGAVALLDRGAESLAAVPGSRHGLEPAELARWARTAADTLKAEPGAVIAPPPLGR